MKTSERRFFFSRQASFDPLLSPEEEEPEDPLLCTSPSYSFPRAVSEPLDGDDPLLESRSPIPSPLPGKASIFSLNFFSGRTSLSNSNASSPTASPFSSGTVNIVGGRNSEANDLVVTINPLIAVRKRSNVDLKSMVNSKTPKQKQAPLKPPDSPRRQSPVRTSTPREDISEEQDEDPSITESQSNSKGKEKIVDEESIEESSDDEEDESENDKLEKQSIPKVNGLDLSSLQHNSSSWHANQCHSPKVTASQNGVEDTERNKITRNKNTFGFSFKRGFSFSKRKKRKKSDPETSHKLFELFPSLSTVDRSNRREQRRLQRRSLPSLVIPKQSTKNKKKFRRRSAQFGTDVCESFTEMDSNGSTPLSAFKQVQRDSPKGRGSKLFDFGFSRSKRTASLPADVDNDPSITVTLTARKRAFDNIHAKLSRSSGLYLTPENSNPPSRKGSLNADRIDLKLLTQLAEKEGASETRPSNTAKAMTRKSVGASPSAIATGRDSELESSMASSYLEPLKVETAVDDLVNELEMLEERVKLKVEEVEAARKALYEKENELQMLKNRVWRVQLQLDQG